MAPRVELLGEFEHLVLLAVLNVTGQGQDPYGVNVHQVLHDRAGRRVARGAVYMTLDRLEKKGLLDSYLTDPTPERGGRAKRCYRATRSAVSALRASRRTLHALWRGAQHQLGGDP